MENSHNNPPQKFCYRENIEQLSVPCPPEDFKSRETAAFRWVFEDMNDERNFCPQFIKDPGRFKFSNDSLKCQALGLSLFDTWENANLQFEKLKRRMLERAYKLGTNLAKGILTEDCGVSDLPNKDGHFNFHSFENTDLKEHFQIVASLKAK